MNNMDSFLDIIIFASGIYLIYSAVLMKTKGEMVSGLIGKNIDWKSVKEENKKAYMKIMIPANIILGIIMIAMSALYTFGHRLGLDNMTIDILIAVSFLIIVAYSAVMINYQNKYLK